MTDPAVQSARITRAPVGSDSANIANCVANYQIEGTCTTQPEWAPDKAVKCFDPSAALGGGVAERGSIGGTADFFDSGGNFDPVVDAGVLARLYAINADTCDGWTVDGAPDVHVTPPSAPPAAPLLLVPAVPVVPVAAAAAAAAGQAAGVVNPIFTSAKSGACRTNDNNKGNAYEELWGESKSNCHDRCLYDSACTGFEHASYPNGKQRCKLFSDAIVSTVPVPGAECYMKAPK